MEHVSSPTTAIVGAGPYGISIAAHLRSAGVGFRIFGQPMNRWRNQMPKGMYLKSDGSASNLSDAEGRFTLERYCTEQGLAYGHRGKPVSLHTFTQYALDFQQKAVPRVEQRMVAAVEKAAGGFHLWLEDGELLEAQNV